MAQDNSFDVVSKVEVQEVKNVLDQASKEVNARFDLKNSKSTLTLEGEDTIQLASLDEYTLKAECVAEEPGVREGGARVEQLGAAEDQAEAGCAGRCGEEDRGADQGIEGEGAGFNPGRHGESIGEGPGHSAAGHRFAARERVRGGASVYQLPHELKGASSIFELAVTVT